MMIWKEFTKNEMKKDYFKHLSSVLSEEMKAGKVIYPNKKDIFNAFKFCPIETVKAVILGMDPYHGPNQAHGLAFSVKKGIPIPPSLRNLYAELKDDLKLGATPAHGCLESLAKRNVLLLNCALTVRAGEPGSHMNLWKPFSDNAISLLNELNRPIVFILMGNFAMSKKSLLTNAKHHILTCSHPSPLSAYRNFFGSKIFSRTNDFLVKNNIEPIDWRIE
jgi:uracil-DNA glycosylase